MTETRSPTLIVSVRRALRLMEAVAAHPRGAPAKRLARETDLPLATTYHLLRTLAYEGYVTRMSEGIFVLGDRLDALQHEGRGQALLTRVRPALIALRDELGAAAYLGIYEDDEIRIMDIADGPRIPRVDLWVGFEDAAHATAIGKCVLSQLDVATRAEYLANHPLTDLTPHTITRVPELMRNLEGSPRISVDREEYALGTDCVAVPVTDTQRSVVGALAVSCRPARLPKIEVPRLRATAARITRTLSLTM